MKKKPRIIFEIDNRKLRDDMNKRARLERRTLKYIVEMAFKEYLSKPLDSQ